MTTRREYVNGLLNERAYKIQAGLDHSDVDTELARFNSGALGDVIEAAVPEGLNKPKRSRRATAAATPPPGANGGGQLPPPPDEGTSAGDADQSDDGDGDGDGDQGDDGAEQNGSGDATQRASRRRGRRG